MADLTDKEIEVLAYTILGEAAGEGTAGMSAVMNTIMNRAASGRYPDNPAAVAVQSNKKGYHQYSTWNSKAKGGNAPRSRYAKDSREYEEALAVVQAALAGNLPDATGGATHYYSRTIEKPYWFDSEAKEGALEIGNHVFAAREKNVASTTNELVPPQPLRSRPVTTIPIDPLTGLPTAEGLDSILQQRAQQRADALRESNPANVNDRSGYEATLPQNASAPGKTSRSGETPRADVSGYEATLPMNASAPGKTSRGGTAASSLSRSDPVGDGPKDFASFANMLTDPDYVTQPKQTAKAGAAAAGAAGTVVTKIVVPKTATVVKTTNPGIVTGKDNTRLMPQGQLYFDPNASKGVSGAAALAGGVGGGLLGNDLGAGPSSEELAALLGQSTGPLGTPLAAPAPLTPQQLPPAAPAPALPRPKTVRVVRQPAAPRYVPPPPVTFQGTATGQTYVAGQVYQNSRGEMLIARPDGSFINPVTGKVSAGSSQGKPKGKTASGTPLTSIAASQRWAADFM